MVTLTFPSGLGNTLVARRPSIPAGLVWPSPVPNRITTEPFSAGFDGEFGELSWFRIAPFPFPDESAENSAGAAAATGNVTGADALPWYTTTICVFALPATEYGTI